MQTPEPGRERGASSGGYSYTPSPTKNKQLEQILDMLYRRRMIIIAALVLVTTGALVYSFMTEPEYKTGSLIMLELNRAPSGGSGAETETPFIRSDRTILTELFILQNDQDIHRRVYERLKEMNESDPTVSYPPEGQVVFTPASRSLDNALQVTSVSTSPREAARLANIYAEEYVRQTQDVSRNYLDQTYGFLKQQEEQRLEELRVAEEEAQRFTEANQAAGLTQSGEAVVAQIASLEAQREAAELDRQMKLAQMATTEDALNEISPQLADRMSSETDRELAALQQQIASLEGQRQTILGYETSQGTGTEEAQERRAADLEGIDRRLQAARAEVRELSETYVEEVLAAGGIDQGQGAVSYAAELRRQMTTDNITLDGLNARINLMNTRIREMEGDLSQIPGQSTEFARLQRQRQQAEQMYQFVVERLQETEIAQQSEPGYARILREAPVPRVPDGPSRWNTIAMGLLLGLALGTGLAFARDKLDNRIYKPDQLRDRDQNVIGVIPNMEPHIKQVYDGALFTEFNGNDVSTSLTTALDPLSAASEAYRHLRTAVQFSRPGVMVQTLLVTSAAPSEGKSTTAANLALTMAQAKRRTLLIDADIRRPKQHTLLGRPLEPGLVQVLLDGEQSLQAFQTSLDENLYVMPAGGLLDNGVEDEAFTGGIDPTLVESPSELLGSKRMRDVLEMLRGQFDIIIIDTPPVLAATEPVLLSTQADATIIVAAAGKTKEGDLDHSLERLSDVGAHVIGTMLNRFDLSLAYGYKYSYGVYGPYSKYSYGPGEQTIEPWWKPSRWSHKA
ncbi:MAG: polysaccharide biosynthesis tyrosine autokinase [Bacteroidota bacterium]